MNWLQRKYGKIMPYLEYLRPQMNALALLSLLVMFCNIGALNSHLRHSHHRDALYHQFQYHERNHEVAMQNADDRRYRSEEFSEYTVR